MSKANELIEEMKSVDEKEGQAPKGMEGNYKLISVPKGLDKGGPGKLVGQTGSFKENEFGIVDFKVGKLTDTDRVRDGERMDSRDTDFSVSGVDGEDMQSKKSGKKLTLTTDITGALGGAKWEFEQV